MKGVTWLRDQWRSFVLRHALPRASAVLLSLFAHVLALAAIILLRPARVVHVASAKYQTIQTKPEKVYLSSSSSVKPSSSHPARLIRRAALTPTLQSGFMQMGTASQALMDEAKQQTAAITTSLRFKLTYGFYPGHDYQLAVQTFGDIPVISADRVPPHYQQYVIVEVTIDTDGQVAEARVVSGVVDSGIQLTLLSAIREFKYTPAKRDGVPIPSQRDLVIHIPS